MDFGFTNDIGRLEAADVYREAAIADGWACSPTYDGSEQMGRASTLTKDGFEMSILSRDRREMPGKWKFEASISIWGPDRLSIKPPGQYDWEKIKAGIRTCNSCGAKDVATHRYSFAGRSCDKCLPEAKRVHEHDGWTR